MKITSLSFPVTGTVKSQVQHLHGIDEPTREPSAHTGPPSVDGTLFGDTFLDVSPWLRRSVYSLEPSTRKSGSVRRSTDTGSGCGTDVGVLSGT